MALDPIERSASDGAYRPKRSNDASNDVSLRPAVDPFNKEPSRELSSVDSLCWKMPLTEARSLPVAAKFVMDLRSRFPYKDPFIICIGLPIPDVRVEAAAASGKCVNLHDVLS